jgi:hypothetical protein
MATIKIRRSTTASAVPGSLVTGEIAVNEADRALYYRKSDGTVASLVYPVPPVTYASQSISSLEGRTVLVNTNSIISGGLGATTIDLGNSGTLGMQITFVNTGSNTLTLQWGLGPVFLTRTFSAPMAVIAVYF